MLFYFISFISIFGFLNTSFATVVCTNNWIGGTCAGSITYNQNTLLTSDINSSGTIIINSGVYLDTNGNSIITGGAIIINGTINSGFAPFNGPYGTNAVNFVNSFGGSGGAGGCNGGSLPGGAGGNTLAVGGAPGNCSTTADGGSGSSPITLPFVDNANIITWNSRWFQNYLIGTGGGGVASSFGPPSSVVSGRGGWGLYLQGQNVIVNGYITSNGNASNTGGVTAGSGGGGVVVIAYNSLYVSGTYNTSGAPSIDNDHSICAPNFCDGGGGGNGNLITLQYTAQPLLTVQANPAAPKGTLAYINITIYNPSSSPLNANTPIEWNLPMATYNAYIANGANNIEFSNTLNTTVMSGAWGAWLQNGTSNTLTLNSPLWVKLPFSISQGNAVNVIQLDFLSLTENSLDGNTLGEAPYLSQQSSENYRYGLWDNGANVFGFYDNFFSTSNTFSSKWITRGAVSSANGLLIANAAILSWLNTNGRYSSGNVLEWYGTMQQTAGANKGSIGYNTLDSVIAINSIYYKWGSASIQGLTSNLIMGTSTISTSPFIANNLWGVYSNGTTAFSENEPIGNMTNNWRTKSANAMPVNNANIEIAYNIGAAAGLNANLYISFIRDRVAPPNNKMPTFKPQGLVIFQSEKLTFENGNSMFQGTNNIITAICPLASDSCAIEANGIVEATGTGTTTYNAFALGLGNYEISANDLSGGESATSVLAIN